MNESTNPLEARVVESLRGIGDADIDRVSEGASVFFDRRWLRLLDELDLSSLLHGEVSFRYVIVRRGDEVVALCPFLIARSASIHLAYSFPKTYFSAWPEELARIDPRKAAAARWLARLLEGLRRVLGRAGVQTDAWIVAVSPLGFRGGIPVASRDPGQRAAAMRAALGALQAAAEEERAPVWFYRFPASDSELREALAACGFDEVFLLYDNAIEGVSRGTEEYLGRFRTGPRGNFKREMAKVRRAGVDFRIARSVQGLEGEIARLYEATYSKYGPEHFAHPPSFWSALERHMGPRIEFILAYRDERLAGFTLLLHKRDLWAFRCGKLEEGGPSQFLYFNLTVYEPIRRAGELGAERLWLGPAAWAAKHHRGAAGVPLHGAFHFPRRAARAVLLPYLRLFGDVTRRELQFLERPSESLRSAG